MNKRQKNLIIAVLILGICLLCFYIAPMKKTVKTATTTSNAPLIIIDAGHGGFDGGAVASDGTNEKDINLKIAKGLSSFLSDCGFEIIMTRTDDSSTESENATSSRKKSDLKNRLKLMNENPDAVFVSIHLNKFTTTAARGSQIFYSVNDTSSKILADNIQTSIVNQIQPENRRVNKQATSSTFLLHNATVPAVLVECGFLSNPHELESLKTEEYQNKLSFSIFCGITEYFNDKEI